MPVRPEAMVEVFREILLSQTKQNILLKMGVVNTNLATNVMVISMWIVLDSFKWLLNEPEPIKAIANDFLEPLLRKNLGVKDTQLQLHGNIANEEILYSSMVVLEHVGMLGFVLAKIHIMKQAVLIVISANANLLVEVGRAQFSELSKPLLNQHQPKRQKKKTKRQKKNPK
jgi:hypothetical protein